MKIFRAQISRRRHLVDLKTARHRILLRLIYRRWPPYLRLIPFFRAHRGTTVVRVGRP